MAENPPNGSLFKGFKKFNTNEFDYSQPLDTATTKILINNLESINNGAMQIRVNCMHSASQTKTVVNDTDFYYAQVDSFGPFPLTVLKNGEFAPLWVSVNAAQTVLDAANPIIVDVKLRPYIQRGTINVAGYTSEGSAEIAVDELAWYELDSPNSLLTISPSVIQYKALKTKGINSDTIIRTIDVPLFMLDVFAYNANLDDLQESVQFLGLFAIEIPWYVE